MYKSGISVIGKKEHNHQVINHKKKKGDKLTEKVLKHTNIISSI